MIWTPEHPTAKLATGDESRRIGVLPAPDGPGQRERTFDTVAVMTHARSPDRAALYADVGRRVRAEVWHRDSTEMYRRHRHDWPDLWLAIDDLITLHNVEDPPPELPGTCDCGCCG